VHHGLAQVLLNHVRRDPEPHGDFLVTEALPVLHHEGGVALRGKLIQYLTQPLDAPRRIQLSSKARQLGELLLHERVMDVEHRSVRALATGVIPGEVTRHRVEEGPGIADCPYVRNAQQADVDLLSELGRVGSPAHAAIEERLQGTPVLGEQPCYHSSFALSHHDLTAQNPNCELCQ
jgi:hypothetical protein